MITKLSQITIYICFALQYKSFHIIVMRIFIKNHIIQKSQWFLKKKQKKQNKTGFFYFFLLLPSATDMFLTLTTVQDSCSFGSKIAELKMSSRSWRPPDDTNYKRDRGGMCHSETSVQLKHTPYSQFRAQGLEHTAVQLQTA